MNYCWWKKCCTSGWVVYPNICRVLYIPGFEPSTVGRRSSFRYINTSVSTCVNCKWMCVYHFTNMFYMYNSYHGPNLCNTSTHPQVFQQIWWIGYPPKGGPSISFTGLLWKAQTECRVVEVGEQLATCMISPEVPFRIFCRKYIASLVVSLPFFNGIITWDYQPKVAMFDKFCWKDAKSDMSCKL